MRAWPVLKADSAISQKLKRRSTQNNYEPNCPTTTLTNKDALIYKIIAKQVHIFYDTNSLVVGEVFKGSQRETKSHQYNVKQFCQ